MPSIGDLVTCAAPSCQEQFHLISPARRYCSEACRKAGYEARWLANNRRLAANRAALRGAELASGATTPPRTPKPCANPACGTIFLPLHPPQRYCSPACGFAFAEAKRKPYQPGPYTNDPGPSTND